MATTRANALHLSNDEIQRLRLIVKHHMRIHFTCGHTITQETWSAALDVGRIFLENYWEKPAEIVSPPRLLDGNEIMAEFDLKPGPRVGEILEAVREAQATGKVHSREAALDFAREWLAEHMNLNS